MRLFWSIARIIVLAVAGFGGGPPAVAEGQALPKPAGHAVDFRREILPILSQHCFRCHAKDEPDGNLHISGQAELLRGGDSGPAIVVGNSAESLLIQLVGGVDADRVMPAEGPPLSPEQIGLLRAWIDQGAKWDSAKEYRLALEEVKLPDGDGNPIDRLLASYFARQKISPAAVISDERFGRRVALDVLGRPLTEEELREFLQDKSADKRIRLVERLLAEHEDYVAHWMTFWSDHLRIGSDVDAGVFDNDLTKAPQEWLKQQLDRDLPYDKLVQELIAGEFFPKYATSISPPGELASAVDRPEMQVAVTISQVFLGIQLKCASCHDSFVDRWTLEDSWGLASALGGEQFELHRCQIPAGKTAAPRFPVAGLGEIDVAADALHRRQRVAELMTADENGLFARTLVNRLWAILFGRGLVEPRDEMMEHEPWNSELLDWLAGELVRCEYDLKHMIRLITTSELYQWPRVVRESSESEESYVFRGPEIRRLTAEQFVDSLGMLQRPAESAASDEKKQQRAWQQGNNQLMSMLGRPGRDVVVTSRDEDVSALVALELINGEQLDKFVQQAAEVQLARSQDRAELANRIVRCLLGREPTKAERGIAADLMARAPDQDAVADFVWTIVMLPEFQLAP